ncbi:hypothetical protein CSB92_0329 [Pseudomonas aeruginosa]|nr:hypothetical protein CSC30_1724 [Pseudomonas aeruginosa]AWF69154.1 hypothetical protein CSC27_4117 [Pseudomonas aeruginosa]PRW12683.1 hypothetical protein CSB92_0329 [Pseudomonas aeruginosa]BAQ41708.1 hypothetical protein PA257_5128 [Pseudomonas aeruginosa]
MTSAPLSVYGLLPVGRITACGYPPKVADGAQPLRSDFGVSPR